MAGTKCELIVPYVEISSMSISVVPTWCVTCSRIWSFLIDENFIAGLEDILEARLRNRLRNVQRYGLGLCTFVVLRSAAHVGLAVCPMSPRGPTGPWARCQPVHVRPSAGSPWLFS